jgi:acylphosphatase
MKENQQIMEIEKRHLKIFGRVQGVGFRHFTVQRARELNLTGWVKNMSDGTVETVIEGSGENVDQMIDKLKKGPRTARVDDIREMDAAGEQDNFQDFTVRR